MIGRREGERMIITGRAAFDAVQAMRAESDAVVIGIGTVLVDNPRLTVRLPGLAERSPVRIDPRCRRAPAARFAPRHVGARDAARRSSSAPKRRPSARLRSEAGVRI